MKNQKSGLTIGLALFAVAMFLLLMTAAVSLVKQAEAHDQGQEDKAQKIAMLIQLSANADFPMPIGGEWYYISPNATGSNLNAVLLGIHVEKGERKYVWMHVDATNDIAKYYGGEFMCKVAAKTHDIRGYYAIVHFASDTNSFIGP